MPESFLTCPRCGARLESSAGVDLCPACVVKRCLEPQVDSDSEGLGIDAAWLETFDTPSLQTATKGLPFGEYELFEEIGQGGMGVVYRARQIKLDRIVALKMLLLGQRASDELQERFQREAQAAAHLHHPGIVAIYEVGEVGGQPFISMDFVQGKNLAQIIEGKPQSARQAATYTRSIAEAVHYAHQQGVIHRDLKPSNVLIDFAEGQVHLTDFGLAKRVEHGSDLTLTGQVLGSPNHMAPELAAGQHHRVGPRSDLYSLGAILYELLTGRPPFLAESMQETLLKIRDAEPVAPCVLNNRVPRDLETICLKCLQKEPDQRYATARELAEELDRFLRGEPIHARPISLIARTGRWCRRRPLLAALAAIIVALVILSTTVAVRMTLAQEGREREHYRANIRLAAGQIQEGSTEQALETLLQCPPDLRHWEWGYLVGECHREALALEDAHNTQLISVATMQISVPEWRCRFSPDGRRLATTHPSGLLQLWELPSGKPAWSLRETNEVEAGIVWLPDWSAVVLARSNLVEIVPVGSMSQRRQLTGHTHRIRRLAVNPAGHRIAGLAADDTLRVWDSSSGQVVAAFPVLSDAQQISFTGDGHRLVVAAAEQAVAYAAETGQMLVKMSGGAENKVAVLPDSEAERFVTIDLDSRARLWSTNGLVCDLGLVLGGWLREAVFSPDRSRFFTSGRGPLNALRDSQTGEVLMSLSGRVDSGVFSPDGRRLATRGGTSVIQIWDLENRSELLKLNGHREAVQDVAFSPDGRLLASVSLGGSVKVWSALPGREVFHAPGLPWGLTHTSDGRRLAYGYLPDSIAIRDTQSGRLVAHLQRLHRNVTALALRPDDRHLAAADASGEIAIWEVETGRLLRVLHGHRHAVYSVVYSRDGHRLATSGYDGTVRIWDADSGQQLRSLPQPVGQLCYVDFSPDGRHIGMADQERVRICSVETGECVQELRGHSGLVWYVLFSPDGTRVATTSTDRTLRLWEVRSGRSLACWNLRGYAYALAFSPDGQRVALRVTQGSAFATDAPTMEIWDVETGRQFLAFRGFIEIAVLVSFSPDGRRLATDWWYSKVRQWESFPWRDAEYPGSSAQPLGERMRLHADQYWRERLEAERQAADTNGTLFVDLPFDRSKIPPRDPAAPPNLVDLTGHYTGTLDEISCPELDGWWMGIDLRMLPKGLVLLQDVPFDLRGIIQLAIASKDPLWERFTQTTDPIPVGKRIRRLHAVIGSIGKAPEGKAIGGLVLHYPDGSKHDCEILYGRHVRHWWTDGDSRTDTDLARVAWEGSHAFPKINPTRLRIYHATWENPHPDQEVVSFDFVSRLSPTAAPFLVAVTVE
jgi:WD40 repeat protein/tRNA A-37 threonylcarbamoyl transferase component Bud32